MVVFPLFLKNQHLKRTLDMNCAAILNLEVANNISMKYTSCKKKLFWVHRPPGIPKILSVFWALPKRLLALPPSPTVSRSHTHSRSSLELENTLVRKFIYKCVLLAWNLELPFIWTWYCPSRSDSQEDPHKWQWWPLRQRTLERLLLLQSWGAPSGLRLFVPLLCRNRSTSTVVDSSYQSKCSFDLVSNAWGPFLT